MVPRKQRQEEHAPRSDGAVSDYGAGAGMPGRFLEVFSMGKNHRKTAGNGGNMPQKPAVDVVNWSFFHKYKTIKLRIPKNWGFLELVYKWGKNSFLAMFEWRCSFTNCWRFSFWIPKLGVWWLKDWRKLGKWRNTWVVHPQELEFVNIWSFKFPIPHSLIDNKIWTRLKYHF